MRALLTTATVSLVVLLAALSSAAAEPAAISATDGNVLGSAAELEATNLSYVDEKLALSLAVETHLQIRLQEYALTNIIDDELEELTHRKLHLYRSLLDTLDELTSGRARTLLEHEDEVTLDRGAATPPDNAPTVGALASVADMPSVQSPATTQAAAPKPGGRKRGGIRSVIQKASDAAIVQVRLQIGTQYSGLLRAQLEATDPGQFDRRYLAAETLNHMQVVAMLRVFEQHASESFARIVHRAASTAETQLIEGRRLTEKLDAKAD
jgi:hypothetical protein